MAKRKKTDAKTSASPTPLAHNPFAALAPQASAPGLEPAKETAPKDSEERKVTPQKAKASAKKAPANGRASAEDAKNWGTKLVLSREKKGRGGKTVTRITGLPKARLELIAKKMKKSLGCGASVDGEDVLLHGMLTERGAAWLQAQGAKRVIIGN